LEGLFINFLINFKLKLSNFLKAFSAIYSFEELDINLSILSHKKKLINPRKDGGALTTLTYGLKNVV